MKRFNNIISNLIVISASLAFAASCDFLDPETDNTRDESLLDEAAYICGPLNKVYSNIPVFFDNSMDIMTDNAVKRDCLGDYYRCSLGALSPDFNPLGIWASAYNNIRYLNIFLDKMKLNDETSYKTPVRFIELQDATSIEQNIQTFWRLKGEAWGLRAYWMEELLKNYGGWTSSGELLGVPMVGSEILDYNDNLKIPRATYQECVDAIVADCDSALTIGMLPDKYEGTSIVYGATFRGRLSGAAVKALKARVLLYAASPAINTKNDISQWEKAAIAAAEAIKSIGGINAAFSTREEYYFTQADNVTWGKWDMIMGGRVQAGNSSFENANYPPRCYGDAQINVSQNYVDAFPDANGYPISESSSYDKNNPFGNRDPRLDMFVAGNGSTIGSYTINTTEGGLDEYKLTSRTSRSGYYLKKTLRTSVSLTPGSSTSTKRVNVILGLPELLLNYAEAANRAWGVTGDPQALGFNAKQALNRILVRDNAKTGADYLNNVIGTDSGKFEDYVRLQRRIELSFEGHYYYDLRRWYASESNWEDYINVTVNGARISKDNVYTSIPLEKRVYSSPWQPIPFSEIFNAELTQNKGW
ncbi:MAG: RagB/SusD family nutrient uptake outer membrane protein [Bacteroidales bacterium]